eukprot:1157352-Pelagomonas_calceolata.AAC.10
MDELATSAGSEWGMASTLEMTGMRGEKCHKPLSLLHPAYVTSTALPRLDCNHPMIACDLWISRMKACSAKTGTAIL